jgi:type II secretory pathway component PulF
MYSEFISLIALGPFGLMIAGVVILWAQACRRARGDLRPGPLATVAKVLGWALLLLGLFAGILLMANVLFLFAWIAAVVVLLFIQYQYQSMERRSLLWVLMAAAEHGIPLESAAREFAEERHDWIGHRALDLAEYLEAGLPVALAFERSRLTLPPAIALATDLGNQTGNLGPALRQVLSRRDTSERVLRTAAEKLFYLGFLILFGMVLWAFLLLKVVPAFQKILHDFGTPMPPATQWLIGISGFTIQVWPLVVLLLGLLLVLPLNGLLYYTGLSQRCLPGFGRLGQSMDGAIVLRWLAVAVRQNRPIAEMMRLLAGYFPRRGARRKLEWAAKRIDQGADWTETLEQAGLIRRPEIAVFGSAERTGNLAWALEEMAESSLRRTAYRLQAVLGIAFPAAVLVLGAGVAMVALGMLAPLITLIQSLA